MLAVIGGTGFGEFAGLEATEEVETDTPYGPARLEKGLLDGKAVIFLPRHGKPPVHPPHKINYRANIAALAQAGTDGIVSVNAVGGIDGSLALPELVFTDQIVDYTWGRAHTFFDDEIHHVDFTYPYDADLRAALMDSVRNLNREQGANIVFRETGVYGCVQGPRLETAAEIRRMAGDGCDVVGMTAMPEAALAREKGIPYAGISVVVN
ncbi:MAG: S-methyl-5'-thioinosine phosphorylase, partial [Pseudomonadales bacterium]|nr:S-methyl-5'-thioinosine phosphorylase [Pseudomonadales bacterium]